MATYIPDTFVSASGKRTLRFELNSPDIAHCHLDPRDSLKPWDRVIIWGSGLTGAAWANVVDIVEHKLQGVKQWMIYDTIRSQVTDILKVIRNYPVETLLLESFDDFFHDWKCWKHLRKMSFCHVMGKLEVPQALCLPSVEKIVFRRSRIIDWDWIPHFPNLKAVGCFETSFPQGLPAPVRLSVHTAFLFPCVHWMPEAVSRVGPLVYNYPTMERVYHLPYLPCLRELTLAPASIQLPLPVEKWIVSCRLCRVLPCMRNLRFLVLLHATPHDLHVDMEFVDLRGIPFLDTIASVLSRMPWIQHVSLGNVWATEIWWKWIRTTEKRLERARALGVMHVGEGEWGDFV